MRFGGAGWLCRAALVLAFMLAGTAGWAPGAAAQDAVRARLSAAEEADIVRIEGYLNGIKTLSSRFIQIASDGSLARGQFFMSRPGKMRFEYDPPSPILIIATGLLLIYYDKELEQVSQTFLRLTPIGVLVRENIELKGDITVTGFRRGPGTLRVTIADTDDPDSGSITLVFSEAPLALRQWQLTDAQGVTTTVTLTDVRTGLPLDAKLFQFREPEFR
ncbi:MAG: outer membrane lipoprotein carrier protein LolA [Proteobacteria bacterium]|nr:outer membrane lipoprotein carrier protein LolA [Pseudomonadota bacterium]